MKELLRSLKRSQGLRAKFTEKSALERKATEYFLLKI